MMETFATGLAIMRFGGGKGDGAFVLIVLSAVAVVAVMAMMRPRQSL